ncbi:transposase, partial [Lactobacillus delbrueckii]
MQEASRSFKISPVRPCKGWRSEILPKMVPQIDARIVCVRNRYNRKDWIALICTDMTIDENEIIRIYGKRWDIEVFFKTCKSFLKLGTEYHGLS